MYIGTVAAGVVTIVFLVFSLAAVGYLLGAVSVRGISLGTAGVLLAALLYGILASYVPSVTLGGREILLFSADLKTGFSIVSKIGTAMFVTAVGLIAGPKFFRSFGRAYLVYVLLGAVIILSAVGVTALFLCADDSLSPEMAVGLMTGALTSTPGLSAAKEVAGEAANPVVAGYGIAYLFGVLGVVLFVQLMPRILRVNMDEERARFVAANAIEMKPITRPLRKADAFGFLPFFLSIAFGCVLGAIYIPGVDFSLGNSGGCLLAGLIVGHFGHLGGIDLRMEKSTLNFYRELGLVLFLMGAGVPGGVSFMDNVKLTYFLYGAVITLIPMAVGYLIAKYVGKLDLFNALGSITGGMTSTPALGSLIATVGTDEVTSAYAATYPIALVCVVIAAKVLLMAF